MQLTENTNIQKWKIKTNLTEITSFTTFQFQGVSNIRNTLHCVDLKGDSCSYNKY